MPGKLLTVPVITPVAELIVKPVGNPFAVHVYGGTLPAKLAKQGTVIV